MNFITGIFEPLALGLSTGTWCVMYCAPVLLPFLLGRETLSHKKNASLVGLFLCGRLASYIALGFALGLSGLLVIEFFDPVLARNLSSIAYIFCGLVLLSSGFSPRILARLGCGHKDGGAGRCARTRVFSFLSGDGMTALFSGLCVGLHICPPFWTAAFRSASSGSPLAGATYFLLFYVGTLPFFIPLLGIPFLSGYSRIFKRIARMTQVLVGGYFFVFIGLIPFLFGRK
jgi:sulfite exporter TauE/SafE